MATSIPKEGLRAIIASLAALPPENVVWDNEPEPFAGPVFGPVAGAVGLIKLAVVARRSKGVDQEIRTYPDPNTTVVTLKGQRVVTISVRADQFEGDEGFDLLESIRTQIQSDDNRAALRAAGCALSSTSDVQPIDYAVDNREVSAAFFDLFLNQTVETSTTLNQPGYIESVEMTATDDVAEMGIIDVPDNA